MRSEGHSGKSLRELSIVDVVEPDLTIAAGGGEVIVGWMKGEGEDRTVDLWDRRFALAVIGLEDSDFAALAAAGEARTVRAERDGVERRRHVLEFAHSAFFFVVALFESSATGSHSVQAYSALGASVGDKVFLRMTSEGKHWFTRTSRVIDEKP